MRDLGGGIDLYIDDCDFVLPKVGEIHVTDGQFIYRRKFGAPKLRVYIGHMGKGRDKREIERGTTFKLPKKVAIETNQDSLITLPPGSLLGVE